MKVKIELETKRDAIDFIKIILINNGNNYFYQDGYFLTEKPVLTQKQKEKVKAIMDSFVISLNRLINDYMSRIKKEV